MTPELTNPPPRVLQWVPCPVCNLLFKDPQGRGGHLRHTRDAAHTAYRASHGLAKPKQTRYPAVAPVAALTSPAPLASPEPMIWVLEEPAELRPLIEPDQPELNAALPPALPASRSEASASAAPSPASPAQAFRPALPQAANGYGALSKAGETPRQGDANASGQAPASPASVLQPIASPSPTLQAMATALASRASSVHAPASPAQAIRLALPEAPNGYGGSSNVEGTGRQTASTGARRPQVGAPIQAPPDWKDPKMAPVALGALSQALMQAAPSSHLGPRGRGVGLVITLGIAGLTLYLVIRQLKADKQPPESTYVLDAAKLVPGAPLRQTGDPYWDHILGYGGHP